MTEAYTLANHLQHLTLLLQRNHEVIQVGGLCRPGLHILGVEHEVLVMIVGPLMSVVLEDDAALLVLQCHFQTDTRRILHIDGIAYLPALFLYIPVLQNLDVLNIGFRTGIEIDLAGNTRKAPEVLVLQIGAVTPAHHLHGYQVLAWLDIFGNVELRSDLRVLAVAYIAAVDPHLEVAGSRTYVKQHLLPLPTGGQHELTAIGTGVVLRLADVWWIGVKGGRPGITDVLIDTVAVTIQFEKPGNGEVLPL